MSWPCSSSSGWPAQAPASALPVLAPLRRPRADWTRCCTGVCSCTMHAARRAQLAVVLPSLHCGRELTSMQEQDVEQTSEHADAQHFYGLLCCPAANRGPSCRAQAASAGHSRGRLLRTGGFTSSRHSWSSHGLRGAASAADLYATCPPVRTMQSTPDSGPSTPDLNPRCGLATSHCCVICEAQVRAYPVGCGSNRTISGVACCSQAGHGGDAALRHVMVVIVSLTSAKHRLGKQASPASQFRYRIVAPR